jgi:Fe-S oxidoreductase
VRRRLAARLTAPGPLTRLVARLGGIDHRRSVPRFAPQTFRDWFASRTDAPTDLATRPRVVLFVDTFTDAFRPEVGAAAVRVLEDAGLAVEPSPRDACCGLTWISTGQLDAAGRILRGTIDGLDRAAQDGMPIVGLEPSCTAVLRSDARELLGEDDAAAARVAAATRTLAEVLATRRPDWQPPRLDGERAVVQPHCHQHAVMGYGADRALLAACGVETDVVGGCCGLAGNFGVERGHYEVSVAVAENELLPAVRRLEGEGTVLTDGFSCHLQVGELAGRRGEHLAELLDRGIRARMSAAGRSGRPPTRGLGRAGTVTFLSAWTSSCPSSPRPGQRPEEFHDGVRRSREQVPGDRCPDQLREPVRAELVAGAAQPPHPPPGAGGREPAR